MWSRKTPNTDTFQALRVLLSPIFASFMNPFYTHYFLHRAVACGQSDTPNGYNVKEMHVICYYGDIGPLLQL